MNEHSISYMQKCMAHDFNDYENLVICRDLLAQISKRPMPQGMDYDPKSDSYEEDVRRECGRIDFHLQELQLSLYPNEEAAPLLYPDNECASTDAFVSSYDSLNNHLKRDLNNTENTLCADDIKTLLLQNEFLHVVDINTSLQRLMTLLYGSLLTAPIHFPTAISMVLVCRSLFIRPHSGNSTPSIFTIFIGTTTINQMMNPIGIPAWMRLAV